MNGSACGRPKRAPIKPVLHNNTKIPGAALVHRRAPLTMELLGVLKFFQQCIMSTGNGDCRRKNNVRTCDTCPGGNDCAAVNLHPILVQVHDLHASGLTDKFDILFSLGEESEALLEKYDIQISKVCWSKAALLAIADIITNSNCNNWDSDAPDLIASAVNAFERFPWQINELVEQAAGLYQEICEREPSGQFAAEVSKRAFVKYCKTVSYQ